MWADLVCEESYPVVFHISVIPKNKFNNETSLVQISIWIAFSSVNVIASRWQTIKF